MYINNFVFIAVFFVVNFYNRPAHDDFYSMFMVREMGVLEGTLFQYNNWCTRYIGVFLSFLITSISISSKYFLFNTFLFALFLFSIFLLYKNMFNKYSNIAILNISLFTYAAVFYSTLDIGETWFWLSANSSYTLSFALLIIGIVLIINPQRKNYRLFLICLIFLLIGGLNEILSLFTICSIMLILFFHKRMGITNWQIMKLSIAVLSIFLTLTILILGEGNAHRETSFSKISIFYSLFLNVKMSGIIFIKHILPKTPIVLLSTIILSVIIPINKSIYEHLNKRNLNFALILLFLIAIYIFQLPITYKTKDISALRALLPITTLFFITLYVILNSVSFLKKYINVVLFISLVFQSSCFVYQFKVSRTYANAYDYRMQFIAKNREHSDTLKVFKLPNSGWIKSSEIENYHGSFTNQHMKKGLDLNVEIIKINDTNN